jgi:hypothetical protein
MLARFCTVALTFIGNSRGYRADQRSEPGCAGYADVHVVEADEAGADLAALLAQDTPFLRTGAGRDRPRAGWL